jgi:hypothetical protein
MTAAVAATATACVVRTRTSCQLSTATSAGNKLQMANANILSRIPHVPKRHQLPRQCDVDCRITQKELKVKRREVLIHILRLMRKCQFEKAVIVVYFGGKFIYFLSAPKVISCKPLGG